MPLRDRTGVILLRLTGLRLLASPSERPDGGVRCPAIMSRPAGGGYDPSKGELHLRLDSDRTVALNLREHPPLDYGYAVTSHSSQGQTADRGLVHIDLERAGEQLVNQRLAYVSISRGRDDAQIYTNDKRQLAVALDRDVSHRAAIEPTLAPAGSPLRRQSRP